MSQAPLPSVQTNGSKTRGVQSRLALAYERNPNDRYTRMRLVHQEMPQRVVRAFEGADDMAVTHLHNLSGGVLGGDQLQLEVLVGAQAQAQITTTGSTRVYRHRPGPDASQQTRLNVHQGGLLEFLPDSLIPYAGARYQQQVSINLEDDAGIFYWDMLTPGREAAGETFAFERVGLSLEIYAAGEAIALERMELEPVLRPLTSPLRWGNYRYMATLYICRVGLAPTLWNALESELAACAQQWSQPNTAQPHAIVWGVSTLVAHGLVVRGLGMNSRQLQTGLTNFWATAKQSLYGRAAHMPRKLL